jgi:putative CocE/NonD family hydrolase
MAPDMRKKSGRPLTAADKALLDGGQDYWLWFLPWRELPEAAFEHETPYVNHWLEHPHEDPWKLDEGCRDIDVPILDIVGWYDHCNGDMLLWRTMAKEAQTKTARNQSRIIIGPWSHVRRGTRQYGDIDFGPEAVMDCTAVQVRWFDHWLKQRDNGVDKAPPVKIFVMGDNQWRDEACWPLKRTQDKVLYLTSDGAANTPAGDGRLVESPPEARGEDHYTFDPKDPVPTLHGKASFTIPVDQKPLADRQDILVYQTEPLAQRVEVTGNAAVELYATTSGPDTDWFVRLIDVAPDGVARDVSQGQLRARYRNGLDKPQLLERDELVKYTIRMNPTSNAFLPGHRIRLDITSSDFPNYDRNHNTAANPNLDATLTSAEQTVHHGGNRLTRIILPHVPNAR